MKSNLEVYCDGRMKYTSRVSDSGQHRNLSELEEEENSRNPLGIEHFPLDAAPAGTTMSRGQARA